MHTILQGKRLIAFDLDGTLIDSVPDLAVGVQRALQEVGLAQPSEDQVRDWVGNGAQVLVERALSWALNAAPEAALQQNAYEAFMRHYGAAPNALTKLYPDASEALHALHEAGFVVRQAWRAAPIRRYPVRRGGWPDDLGVKVPYGP